MSTETREAIARFAVIGNPVAHSRSPDIHDAFGRQTGIDLVYDKLPAEEASFEQVVNSFFASGGMGLNVTVPFKRAAYQICARHCPASRTSGAVNTIARTEEGLCGFNTDGTGLVTDIKLNIGVPLNGMRLLLLGAGGAVRGVLPALLEEHPGMVTVANRTRSRADEIAAMFHGMGNLSARGLDELAAPDYDIIVNGTSASLSGGSLPVPGAVFGQAELAYDMMYGPATAPFARAASDGGAKRVTDGFGMLVEQAAEAFRIWHGVRPETADVIALLREGS